MSNMVTPWADVRHSTQPPRDHSGEADPDAGPTPMELALAEAEATRTAGGRAKD